MNAVAKAYGNALFEIALEENKCEDYRKMLLWLKESMDDKFVRLLTHPKVSKDEKKECIENVYGSVLDRILLNFLKVLVDKNRFQYMKQACDAFDEEYVAHFNILIANVTSARVLNEEEKKQLVRKLEMKMNQSVECHYDVDESLLAGIKVQMNDFVMDNTALNRLTKLRDQLSG